MAQATYTSNLDAIMAAMKAGIEAGVTEAVEKMAARARQECPVGTIEHGARQYFYRSIRGRRKVNGDVSYRTVRINTQRNVGYTARRPGTLRDSIFTRVRWKDGVCLGWVKAGAEGSPDGSAFYAPFVEFGTSKMQANPFLRRAARSVDLQDIAGPMKIIFDGSSTRSGVKPKWGLPGGNPKARWILP